MFKRGGGDVNHPASYFIHSPFLICFADGKQQHLWYLCE